MKYLTYRDLPSDPDVKQGFNVENVKPNSKILKVGIIPGLFGLPNVYVNELYFFINKESTMILCITEKRLTSKADYWEIYQKAKAFLEQLES